jgi:hypothetical protein
VGALLALHPLLRKAWNAVVAPLSSDTYGNGGSKRPTATSSDAAGEARLEQRASFDFAFGILYLFVLHGVSALKVLLILHANYRIAKTLPRRYVPAATWIFNVCMLFANELCRGYHFKSLASLVTPPPAEYGLGDVDPLLVRWGSWLDSWGGLMPRWEILFNITVLRLISFNMDYYWSTNRSKAASAPIEVRTFATHTHTHSSHTHSGREGEGEKLRTCLVF